MSCRPTLFKGADCGLNLGDDYENPRSIGPVPQTRIEVMIDLSRLHLFPQLPTMIDPEIGKLWREHESGYEVFVGNIEKPDLDGRNYRVLELKNGLKAVLVSDPVADKSAACLRVAVGSLYDPVRTITSSLELPRI